MTAGNNLGARVVWLFWSTRGRIPRGLWWGATTSTLGVYVALSLLTERLVGDRAALVLYPPLYYVLIAIAIKRCHDYDRSGAHLLLGLVPLVGSLFVALELGWKRGTAAENRFGPLPRYHGLDHLVVDTPTTRPGGATVVNDVTQLNPVEVAAVVTPTSVEQLQQALRGSTAPVSIGGGHFSMGGQTASPGTAHIDMRRLNAIVWLRPLDGRVRVQAGLRFCDLQRALDPHDLSIKTMQTYANFTVGGAVSVNAHGRYLGLGPIVLSVRAIDLLLADGTRLSASPEENPELFYGAIGGYGALGIIVECELDLANNVRVERIATKVSRQRYVEHFKQHVRSDPRAIFHNADLYLPAAEWCRAVTWRQTEAFVTVPRRLMRVEPSHRIYRYLAWSLSELPFAAWRREHVIDPLLYASRAVHWRNYEAGYDVAELEPEARRHSTYVLQEYFVPVERLDDFVPKLREIFGRHRVNVLNVSIRHALPDPGTLLAWAREEVFAFVVYYKQRTDAEARAAVAVWTRELIEAALACGGRYYLPYQPHARADQFHRAYPGAKALFALKRTLDPQYRLRNALWDRYYDPDDACQRDDPANHDRGRTAAAKPIAAAPGEARASRAIEAERCRQSSYAPRSTALPCGRGVASRSTARLVPKACSKVVQESGVVALSTAGLVDCRRRSEPAGSTRRASASRQLSQAPGNFATRPATSSA